MKITLDPIDLTGEVARTGIFGGNVLAPRTSMTGEGSYGQAIEEMNITSLRYPGGSLTEFYFDLENPDASTVHHSQTGEVSGFIPLSDFLGYAGLNGNAATIVIPTRDQLSDDIDANGNRETAIDEQVLREFVHDVMTGVYGDANIAAFEIGNEYWGSGGMNATEYGKLSSQMALIIKEELRLVEVIYRDVDATATRVVVQMGHNFGTSRLSDEYEGWVAEDVIADLNQKYNTALTTDTIRGNGEVNWTEVNNELVQIHFDTAEEQEALDGIVAHVNSRGENNDGSKSYDLKHITNDWLKDPGFEDLEIHVTEWNQKSTANLDRDEDYGLLQAHEMLNIVEEFMAYGVDQAHVWPLIQNTANPLSVGMDYSGMTVPGHMFSMMSENLTGKTMLDFTPSSDRETQLETADVDLHGFAGDNALVFYIASVAGGTTTTDIDISNLVSSYSSMDIKILGVADGFPVGSTRSQARIEDVDSSEISSDGIISATLGEREIMQIILRDVVPTPEFAATMAAANGEPVSGPQDPTAPGEPREDEDAPPAEDNGFDPDTKDDTDPGDDGADLGDLAWLMVFIPLLALAGFS